MVLVDLLQCLLFSVFDGLQGAIDVQNLEVRYRADLDPVLKGISFSVRGREKVRADTVGG